MRERVAAERERAEASARELEAARAELADWTAGGPVARAWRAFVNRRGQSVKPVPEQYHEAAEGEVRGLREALAEAQRPFWRRWLDR